MMLTLRRDQYQQVNLETAGEDWVIWGGVSSTWDLVTELSVMDMISDGVSGQVDTGVPWLNSDFAFVAWTFEVLSEITLTKPRYRKISRFIFFF